MLLSTIIRPFKAIRPGRDKVHLVASRSYITYSSSQLRSKLSENPYTFIHIINPDFADRKPTKPGSLARLKKIRSRFNEFLKQDIFIRDQQADFYIYRQVKNGAVCTGIIGCASIDDYFSGKIKVHEQTLTKREELFKNYLKVCDFNAEPVCFFYPDNPELDQLIAQNTTGIPEYDFSTTDRIRHTLWRTKKPAVINKIIKAFENIPAIYIADGHHRSASSALLGQELRKQFPDYSGDERFNFFMGLFVPEKELKIYAFNRVIKDLGGLSPQEFLEKISENFTIEYKGENSFQAEKLHNFSLYLAGNWYSLTAKPAIYDDQHPVKSLDSYLLTEAILAPLLGIKDLKTDDRVDFTPGDKGLKELQRQVDSGKMKAGFGLYPVTVEQLKKVADAGLTMPPKSTWVEPKLRSGLVIYNLELGLG